jgi:DNA-binding winged helix-turn-helix (wHTH) protein
MSAISAVVTYRFGEFEVDPAVYEVRRDGHRIRLARQPMDLLLLLLERRQELVSRADIVKRLWGPDVFTDLDAGIHTAVLKIRQVLGDSRESPRFVETVAGKGYIDAVKTSLGAGPFETARDEGLRDAARSGDCARSPVASMPNRFRIFASPNFGDAQSLRIDCQFDDA